MNHYFTDNRHLAQNRKEITFRFSCFTCHFLTDNGVFCKDHVDFGTRTLLDAVHASGLLGEELMDADEKLFQQMWKTYFKSIAIKERLNPKLHRQHMPARFWKYMPEKL